MPMVLASVYPLLACSIPLDGHTLDGAHLDGGRLAPS